MRYILDRMQKQYRVDVGTKPPRIPYRETVTAKAEGHHRHFADLDALDVRPDLDHLAGHFVPQRLRKAQAAEARGSLMAYVGTFSSPLRDTPATQVDLPPGNGRGIHLFRVDRTTGALSPDELAFWFRFASMSLVAHLPRVMSTPAPM